MTIRRPKKCPRCGSSRVSVKGSKLICRNPACGYENDLNPNRQPEIGRFRARDTTYHSDGRP
jgi:hypothetical protein